MLLVPEYKHTHTHHCVSSLHDINTSQKHNCIEVEVSVYLQLIILMNPNNVKDDWMMYVKYAHRNSTTNCTTSSYNHMHRACTQLQSPGKHCSAPWVRCSSFEDLREIQTSFMWTSVQWSYVSKNSSKLSGKVKIVDLKKKAAASYTSQCQPRFTSAAYASSEWSTWQYPNTEQICIQRKTVLASTLVFKP